jgi:hypothetical protein
VHRSSLTSRFLAGWEPAVLPARGPDGMIPAPPPSKLPVIEPPRLCEAGPCRHYHRVESLLDAQGPMDGSGDPAHTQVTRACYPAVGIELELSETPVLRCSRWEPDNEQARLDGLRDQFLKSPNGKQYAAQLAAFEEAVAEQDEIDNVVNEQNDADREMTPDEAVDDALGLDDKALRFGGAQ